VLAGLERDTLRARWEERRWTEAAHAHREGPRAGARAADRQRARAGRVLGIGADFYVEVEAQPEPVLAVRPRDAAEAIRTAFEVGNRHFSLALDGERCSCPTTARCGSCSQRLAVASSRRRRLHPVGSAIATSPASRRRTATRTLTRDAHSTRLADGTHGR
jgi:hypothetical protein